MLFIGIILTVFTVIALIVYTIEAVENWYNKNK
jgi:hypothetical protein